MAATIYPFIWPHRWTSDSVTRYKFNTVVELSQSFYEQRRPLLETPKREVVAEYIVDRVDAQKFLNDLRRFSLTACAVPIYDEILTPTEDLQGLSTISVNEDLEDYYNISNCQLVLIRASADLYQLKQVTSVGANIVLDSAVDGDFLVWQTQIFPCIVAIIFNKSLHAETDAVIVGNVEFQEVDIAWQIA